MDPGRPRDGMTGTWNLDVMLKSGARHIAARPGPDPGKPRLSGRELPRRRTTSTPASTGATPALSCPAAWTPPPSSPSAAVLLLIIFTGYLIIYNVFQISVTNDIRFYGLLKTIGTTPRQLRRIIRHPGPGPVPGGHPPGAGAGLAHRRAADAGDRPRS